MAKLRIRLAVVVPTLRGGGAERMVSLLLARFNRDTIRPHLVSVFPHVPAYPVPEDVPHTSLAALPIRASRGGIVNLTERLSDEDRDALAWMEGTARNLARLLKRLRTDCVLGTPIWASLLASLAHQRMRSNVAFIARVDAYPSHALARSNSAGLLTALAYRYLNGFHSLITASRGTAEELVGTFGVEGAKIVLIPNGIDLERVEELSRVRPPPQFQGENALSVVYVGRLEEVKGVEVLLKAVSELPRATGTRLFLVGEGPQRARLETLATELGIGDRVSYLGWQSNPYALMRRATVLAVPSLSEGMSNVLLEGLACGCAIVATDVASGSTREVLEDGKCGMIVPPGDAGALAEGILRLLRDRELREQLATAARERAQAFNIDRVTREYERGVRRALEVCRGYWQSKPVLHRLRFRRACRS